MRVMLAVLGLLLACAGGASAQVPETAPEDGDAPLPAGALAHIGTTRLRHGGAIVALLFSPDGRILASTGDDEIICCWDLATGKQVWAGAAADYSRALAFSPDGATLASSDYITCICLWNAKTGRKVVLPVPETVEPTSTQAIAFSTDAKRLTLLDTAYQVVSYEIASRKFHRAEIQGRKNQGGPWSAMSADAKYGAANGDLWRSDTGKMIGTLPAAAQIVAVSPDGRHVASSGKAHFDIWEVAKPRFRHAVTAPGHRCPTFAADGRTFATAAANEVRLFDLDTGKQCHVLRHETNTVIVQIAFSPDTRLLATGSAAGVIRLWDVGSGRQRLLLPGGLEKPTNIAWRSDHRTLAVQAAPGVYLFDVASSATPQAPWKVRRDRLAQIRPDGSTRPQRPARACDGCECQRHQCSLYLGHRPRGSSAPASRGAVFGAGGFCSGCPDGSYYHCGARRSSVGCRDRQTPLAITRETTGLGR